MTLFAAALFALAQDEVQVEVVEVSGSVEFKLPGKEHKWEAVKAGSKLARGAMVQTGLKSKALLQFGRSTKVLVRASTFAVINEAFLKKNELKGELRVDVGSVHVDADENRDEKLEFKVTTPQGTAAIRGTRLSVRTSDVGLEAVGEKGVTDLHTVYGYDYRLGEHLREFLSSIAGDLAEMAGAEPSLADDNLSRLDPHQGDRSWATRAFNPSSEANELMHRVHYTELCAPFVMSNPSVAVSSFHCGVYTRWRMEWDLNSDAWNYVVGDSPIAGGYYDSNFNLWHLRLHGRTVFLMQEVSPGTQWMLKTPAFMPLYLWDAPTQTWTPQ